jgi:flagellar export protein FliJ
MAFRFRLGRVLALRTQLRKLVQDEVALLGGQLSRLREDVAAAQEAERSARATAEAQARVGLSGEELRRWEAYERALAGREAALAEESARVAEAIVRGREELLTRRREERKLEHLEERARGRFVAEEARQEALLLDDLARRQRAEGEGR